MRRAFCALDQELARRSAALKHQFGPIINARVIETDYLQYVRVEKLPLSWSRTVLVAPQNRAVLVLKSIDEHFAKRIRVFHAEN